VCREPSLPDTCEPPFAAERSRPAVIANLPELEAAAAGPVTISVKPGERGAAGADPQRGAAAADLRATGFAIALDGRGDALVGVAFRARMKAGVASYQYRHVR
jgi:hypothetical protein